MPTITRTLISVHLPIDLRVFSATLRAVIDGYTDFVTLESSDYDVGVVRLVVVEDVDDDELARRGAVPVPDDQATELRRQLRDSGDRSMFGDVFGPGE